MTVTLKGTREAAAAAMAKEFQKSDHEINASGEEEEDEDSTSDSEKQEKDIEEWIGQPRKPPSINEDEESDCKEENLGAIQSSTEDNYPIDEYKKGRDFDWEEDRKDTVLLYTKNTEKEASLRYEGESSSSDSSDSDDNDDDDDKTSAKDNTCYGDGVGAGAGDGGGDSTITGGGSVEWMRFLSPSALSETLGVMAKAKASSSTKSRKTRGSEKVEQNSTAEKGCK